MAPRPESKCCEPVSDMLVKRNCSSCSQNMSLEQLDHVGGLVRGEANPAQPPPPPHRFRDVLRHAAVPAEDALAVEDRPTADADVACLAAGDASPQHEIVERPARRKDRLMLV